MMQTFQPVQNTNPDSPDAGRAGTVRGSEETDRSGEQSVQVVPVQYDGEDTPRMVPLIDLRAL